MSKVNEWMAAPSRAVSPKAAPQNKAAVFVRSSVSWTADYPEAINRLLLDAQQLTGDPSFNKSLVMRAAVRALEQMEKGDRLALMKQMQAERDAQS